MRRGWHTTPTSKNIYFKGQLISKYPSKTKKLKFRIFALASEKRSNQKSSARDSKSNPQISHIKGPYFFI